MIELFASSVCMASVFSWPDETFTSENNHYVIRATSPDNADGGLHVGQTNFIYSLTDNLAKTTIWTRKQKVNEPYCMFFVNDNAYSVRLYSWTLIVIDPKGNDIGRIDLMETAIPKDEAESYIVWSTAGESWGKWWLRYFIEINDRQYFVIRTWWGRRIIVDLKSGNLVKDASAIESRMEDQEKKHILSTLANGIKMKKHWEKEPLNSWDTISPVLESAFLAGKRGITNAVPLLRELEEVAWVGEYRGRWETITSRQIINQALRRLGQKPLLYPSTQFSATATETYGEQARNQGALQKLREDILPLITLSVSPGTVLQTLGFPDVVEEYTSHVIGIAGTNEENVCEWYYDIDAKEPFTLLIDWDGEKIQKLERLIPALWKTEKRDREIVY